jgi:hypothetical protein
MLRCINCGVYCNSEDDVDEGEEGVILAHAWYCDACYEVVSENLARLELEREVYNKKESV